MSSPGPAKIPQHVAIIMDGNGRWAKARGLPRLEGHRLAFYEASLLVETGRHRDLDGLVVVTASEATRQISDAIGRPVDVLVHNVAGPSEEVLARYANEHKRPLELGPLPAGCELVEGDFWQDDIARHDRRRLAFAVWFALAKRLL